MGWKPREHIVPAQPLPRLKVTDLRERIPTHLPPGGGAAGVISRSPRLESLC